MLNHTVLVGRLVRKPEKEIEDGKEVFEITLAVPRSYKNENGEYETDFITCTLPKKIGESTFEYCKKGDVLGVKGRVETQTNRMKIVAEKVTFLSSSKEEE